jgi:hypothetical protein
MLGVPTRKNRKNAQAAAERAERTKEYDGMADENMRRPERRPGRQVGKHDRPDDTKKSWTTRPIDVTITLITNISEYLW